MPKLTALVLESGCFVPVQLICHRGVRAPARRSILGRRAVAQRLVAVSVVVRVLEVADDHAVVEQGVPVIAVEALLT